jgi:peptidoglycan/LPS O-acetylase OafA/YrhL
MNQLERTLMKTSTRLKLALGIAGMMILASAVASWIDRPEFGTMMVFMLIALAAAMGVLSSDSACNECKCIRNLFGRKQAVESEASESEVNPFGPEQR